MRKCVYCGAPLPDNNQICEYCCLYNREEWVKKKSESPDGVFTAPDVKKPSSNEKFSSLAIVSFITALLPLIVILYCLIVSGGSMDESSSGAAWWALIFYYWTIGFPALIVSVVTGILSLKKNKKDKLAKTSLIMAFSPFILLILIVVITNILGYIVSFIYYLFT